MMQKVKTRLLEIRCLFFMLLLRDKPKVQKGVRRTYSSCEKTMRQPRIERGAHRWQRWILPLNHWRFVIVVEIIAWTSDL